MGEEHTLYFVPVLSKVKKQKGGASDHGNLIFCSLSPRGWLNHQEITTHAAEVHTFIWGASMRIRQQRALTREFPYPSIGKD